MKIENVNVLAITAMVAVSVFLTRELLEAYRRFMEVAEASGYARNACQWMCDKSLYEFAHSAPVRID
ncbi:hypothetical protein TPR58_03680 [Sphingomonas sp. HF-S3]|uniref:Uncharacterized protein n=1 Tax=Sphingomonas rustica TaxID=3103142 RepID=A0ABV0B3U8_9SPHN